VIRPLLRLIAAVLLLSAPGVRAAPQRIVIDDDGFGLMQMMLLGSKDVEVLGITTVSGDVWANRATAMALKGVEAARRMDVPVIEGATYPLVNTEAATERWEALYGKLTWKGAWMRRWVEPTRQSTPPYHGPADPVDLPGGNPTTKPALGTAAEFLIRTVRAHPGEVTIVATGPMTNLALAQRLDPQFARLAKGLVYMMGSFNPRQMRDDPVSAEFAREFANSPRREFNARFDPEAASIVSRAPWRSIVAVPVDPSTATQLTRPLLDRIAARAKPGVRAWLAGREPGFPLWDEIAAGVLLNPTIATNTERLYVDYDTQFGPGYGDTLSWREAYRPGLGEQPATVVRAIDPKRLEALMARTIGGR
jgi:inosine-uridine nucleoside N-ribohydrolase